MKKIYIKPIAEFEPVEPNDVICASNPLESKSRAEWGSKGDYAPGEWMNEGYQGVDDTWPSVAIEEDTKDLFSR